MRQVGDGDAWTYRKPYAASGPMRVLIDAPDLRRTYAQALLRGVALGLTLALHLGLLLWVLLPSAPWRVRPHRVAAAHGMLRVRLIPHRVSMARHPPPRLRLPHARPPVHARVVDKLHGPVPPAASTTRNTVLIPLQRRPDRLPDYVPDIAFARRLRDAQHASAPAALPGSAVPIVPGLHMVDPRSQGLAGVVRGLAGLFGAVDKHCVEVDSWQHMSPGELAARDLTMADVKDIAEKYGCLPRHHAMPVLR